MGKPKPGEHDIPRSAEQAGVGFSGLCAAGGEAAIPKTTVLAATDVAVPEIEFQVFPAASFPAAALAATTIGGCFHGQRLTAAATACKDQEDQKYRQVKSPSRQKPRDFFLRAQNSFQKK